MRVLTAILGLIAATSVFGEGYRTGTCGQSTTNKCERIVLDNDGVVTSNRHNNQVADHVMEHELDEAIGSIPTYDLAGIATNKRLIGRLQSQVAITSAFTSIPSALRDESMIGFGISQLGGSTGVAVGASTNRDDYTFQFKFGFSGNQTQATVGFGKSF